MSQLEDELIWQLHAAKLPTPQREGVLITGRRYRFDLVWPLQMLACEVNGGVWTQGRHTRGAGAESDAEKLTLAALSRLASARGHSEACPIRASLDVDRTGACVLAMTGKG